VFNEIRQLGASRSDPARICHTASP
jgi:hypothetical protein